MTFGCRKQTAISKKEIADCSVINKVIFWHNKKVSDFPRFIFRIALLQSSFRLQFVITPCIFWCIIFLRMRSLESSTLHYGIISCTELCATQQNVCVSAMAPIFKPMEFSPQKREITFEFRVLSGAIRPYPTDLTVRPQKVSMSVTTGRGDECN
jgi:hypothetical protein